MMYALYLTIPVICAALLGLYLRDWSSGRQARSIRKTLKWLERDLVFVRERMVAAKEQGNHTVYYKLMPQKMSIESSIVRLARKLKRITGE